MDLYYKDELHLIEKGYKKLANSIHEIVKDPKKDLQHYPNITYDQPVIKTNTHFPPLPTKSMLSTIKVYTNNLTNSTRMPLNKYALLKNIGATKAKENEMVVTARNCNERINKKISTRTPTFPFWKNRTPSPPPLIITTTTTTTTTTITTMTRTTPVIVRKAITR